MLAAGKPTSGGATKHQRQADQPASAGLPSLASAGLLVPALVLVPVLVLVLEKELLTGLAMRMADDPINQVKKMIKDLKKMIVKLMEETNEEGDEQRLCDGELVVVYYCTSVD